MADDKKTEKKVAEAAGTALKFLQWLIHESKQGAQVKPATDAVVDVASDAFIRQYKRPWIAWPNEETDCRHKKRSAFHLESAGYRQTIGTDLFSAADTTHAR